MQLHKIALTEQLAPIKKPKNRDNIDKVGRGEVAKLLNPQVVYATCVQTGEMLLPGLTASSQGASSHLIVSVMSRQVEHKPCDAGLAPLMLQY